MPVFTYAARDDTGRLIEGDVTASNQMEAARIVRSEGHFVVRVDSRNSRTASSRARSKAMPKRKGGGKLKQEDVIFFTNQLAVMVETGVSLVDALDACVHKGNSPRFAAALDSIIEQVRGGMEFSAAVGEHPRVFPSIYVSLIKASEASGQLAPILKRLAEHLQRQYETNRRIKGALVYPVVMCLFALGVTVFMVAYVLPKFKDIYAGREDKLPALTKYLLSFSDLVVAYGLYSLGAVILAGVGAFFYLRTPGGRLKAEQLKLRLPLAGPMFHKSCQARSMRTLGTMIQSGVAMLDAVQLTRNVCGSAYYEQMWTAAHERIQQGQQISEALAKYEEIPQSVLKMINAGERSGRLGTVMERVAAFGEEELNAALKTLTGMIEPAIIMVLGVVVGGLVLALLLPIFTISKALH
jgi:type IV pilus assembly protein PilC